jgi:prepilin-type N-terminal cleavage/methylation domain-containing protein/prepilin-type processing-associated H-X9-DG protein
MVPRARRSRAFTLIELLVVIAIVSMLLAISLPSISAARNEGVRLKCVANLAAIGQGLQAYAIDDRAGMLIPVHGLAEDGWRFDGEYEYGGNASTLPGFLGNLYRNTFGPPTRVLNRFLFGDVGPTPDLAIFRCPTDTGVPDAPANFDPSLPFEVPLHDITGTSYRINNHIRMYTDTHFYGPYMRRSTRIPESSTTVAMAETIAQVAIYNRPPFVAPGWHTRPGRYNVAFTDGHAASIAIQGGHEPPRDEFGGYWVFRGEGWRLDCYPDPPVFDAFRRQPDDHGGPTGDD